MRTAPIKLFKIIICPPVRSGVYLLAAMSNNFIKDNAGGNRNIQGCDVAKHRQPNQRVAVFSHKTPQSAVLAAENQGNRSVVIKASPVLSAGCIDTDNPH